MRRKLISAAALALLAAPVLFGSSAGAQTYSRSANPADNRRPGEFPALPGTPAAAPAAAAPAAAPADRGNGERGNRGAAAPAATPQPQAAAPQGRGDRGDRGNGQDRGNWQGQRGQNNNNQYNNNYNNRGNGYGNRGNGYGNRGGYGGQRHDFSSFRDYHRDYRVSRRFRAPYYRRPSGWYDHQWSFGEFLPTAFWARDYWLSDYREYDLPEPPYGAVWVRVGTDALLVDEDSGEVITVANDVFY